MTLNNIEHCTLSTFEVDGEVKIYDFIADDKYCFRNNADPQTDENGNEYYDYFTAFSLLSNEIDTLENFECVPYAEGMVMH